MTLLERFDLAERSGNPLTEDEIRRAIAIAQAVEEKILPEFNQVHYDSIMERADELLSEGTRQGSTSSPAQK